MKKIFYEVCILLLIVFSYSYVDANDDINLKKNDQPTEGNNFKDPFKDPMSTQDLLDMYSNPSQKKEFISFIKGIRSGATAQKLFSAFMIRDVIKVEPPGYVKALLLRETFCPPPDFSDEDFAKIVIDYIKELPTDTDKKSISAGFTVIMAIYTKYPCN